MNLLDINRISKEYINTLPAIQFDGQVVMVNRPEQVEEVVRLLKNESCVGFDTESKPAFKKGESYPVSLVQLATHDTSYLFQLEKTGIPDSLVEFFSNPSIKKIGVGIKHDIEKLQDKRNFKDAGFVDLSNIAKEKGIIQVGARSLAARYLGRRLVKTAQKTNWAKPKLTPKQQVYAATDAWICLKLLPLLEADQTDYRQFLPGEEEVTE